MLLVLGFVAFILGGLLLVRVALLLQEHPSPSLKAPRQERLKVCVVLGSGGHTSEMMNTLRVVPAASWKTLDLVYIVSSTDKDSRAVAERFEKSHGERCARVFSIPRAREVGQSYLTSVWSTLRALHACLSLMWTEHPDAIVTNGPGVCIPVVGAALLIAALCFTPRPLIAYFESFTCVDHLSMSGVLLLPVADVFTVQWQILFDIVKRKKRQLRSVSGRLWFTGPVTVRESTPSTVPPHPIEMQEDGVALVTVGSTKFDDLMQQVDSPAFFAELRRRGIKRCLVQKGRSEYKFKTPTLGESATGECFVGNYDGVEVEVFQYRPFLQETLRTAALVVSHAGAGTILEALEHGRSLVVVPNEKLMSNHQLQLARSLADEKYLFFVMVHDLCDALPRLASDDLARFPPPNVASILETFRRVFRRSL